MNSHWESDRFKNPINYKGYVKFKIKSIGIFTEDCRDQIRKKEKLSI